MTPPAGMLVTESLTLGYGHAPVVHEVSLTIPRAGSSVALIGESGSGKTTVARAILGLLPVLSGRVLFHGQDTTNLRGPAALAWRRGVQPVFQDGVDALNPRMSVAASIGEGLVVRGVRRAERGTAIADLLTAVGLEPEVAHRKPHQLSGGQRQRVVIARALAPDPDLLVLDEPTSALDVTVQARILDVLEHLRAERQVAMLLITHNLALGERLCDDAYVMFAGRVVEHLPVAEVVSRPRHPYTRRLLAAVPRLGGSRPTSVGELAVGEVAHSGCAYQRRCPVADARCESERPPLATTGAGALACHHPQR